MGQLSCCPYIEIPGIRQGFISGDSPPAPISIPNYNKGENTEIIKQAAGKEG